MIAYELTDEDRALIQRFNDAVASIGFDGIHSLNPSIRGVIEATELAKKFTLLRALEKLGLKGTSAKEFAWGLNSIEIPLTESEIRARLNAIFTAE